MLTSAAKLTSTAANNQPRRTPSLPLSLSLFLLPAPSVACILCVGSVGTAAYHQLTPIRPGRIDTRLVPAISPAYPLAALQPMFGYSLTSAFQSCSQMLQSTNI
ncbi:hypothetical protein BDV12DRAFT_46600 [Aspergillus spectabilis]